MIWIAATIVTITIVIRLAQVSGQNRSQEDKDQEQFLQEWNQKR